MIRVRFHAKDSAGAGGEKLGHFEDGRLICAGSEIKPADAPTLEITEIDGDDSDLARALAAGYRVVHPAAKQVDRARQRRTHHARNGWPEGAQAILEDPDIPHKLAAEMIGIDYRRLVKARTRMGVALNPHNWKRKTGPPKKS